MLLEKIHHRRKRARQVEVITVQVPNNVPSRPLESFVDCIHLSPIRFTDPKRQLRFVLADDVRTVVSTAAINHNVLKVSVPLVKDRANCFFNVVCLIK